MILNEIELQNFRQYKKPIKINFSNPHEEGNSITLIIAANGVGKTTLLQAFRFCFYGQRSSFLDLPNKKELINNTLSSELKELEQAEMYVRILFTHKNTKYLAIRSQRFVKRNGELKESGSENFSLSSLTETRGWKELVDPQDKIQSILPDGLSQVFMFDGERMQRNFADKKFGEELRESILGILDIKKYDKLIDIIGSENRANSVLGMLNRKIISPNEKEQKTLDDYNKYLTKQAELLRAIDKINDELDVVTKELEETKAIQAQLEENKERVSLREKADQNYQNEEKELERLAQEYLNKSRMALTYKLLIEIKERYDDFINKGHTHEMFYEYLHVNTLEDIIDKGICVCGRKVEDNSKEKQRLNELKSVSLPIESAQNINLISQKMKKSVDYDSIISDLKEIKEKMVKSKARMSEFREESNKINREIIKVEQKFGNLDYEKYDRLQNIKSDILVRLGEKKRDLELVNRGIENGRRTRESIEQSNEGNRKVRSVINIVHEIKGDLSKYKLEKDRNARNSLAKHFDSILTKTLQGNYSTTIDDRYKIQIINTSTKIDETSVLSTGQNIVVSLSFVNALIATAKELSPVIDKNEKYGVIMDAALSNLDETHISRVCKNNINNLDQLIFMSFKKQLRDEMYIGIKEKIGKAYLLSKHKMNYIEKIELPIGHLDAFIHGSEEEENE